MGDYSNGDIQRLHERIDELGTNLRTELKAFATELLNLAVAIGKIETHIKLLPPQASRPCQELTDHLKDHKEIKRPCPELTTHLEDHKEVRALWQKPLVSKLIDLALLAITAIVFMFIGERRAENQTERPQPETRATAEP